MLKRELTEKICEMLLCSCRRYFQENVPGKIYPEEVDIALQITRDPSHGDLSSNIAMRLARAAGRSPSEIAESVVSVLKNMMDEEDLTSVIGTVEVKGGFINFRLSEGCFAGILRSIIEEGDDYGRSFAGKGGKVNLEYVSANPTGPLTIAHGRQAAIGDALSRILRFNGYEVTSEYYLNDFGRQIKMLGRSLQVRYKSLFGEDEPMPEDGYMGGYVIDIAEKLKKERGGDLLGSAGTDEFFRGYAVDHIMALIRKDLRDFGVTFDVWTSQAVIEERKEVDKVLDLLQEKGLVYEDNGAKWFSSTSFGDDKDRVVVKSDGSFTYLAPDMAYHKDKFKRGFTQLIDLLGPDHHGYIKRMKAAVSALGYDPASLDILIVQLVTLSRGAEQLSMSTRKGEFISLRQLIDELGKDVTRFFFLSRRLDSHLDFDIELAKRSSSDNPVYYIQYAHARICSIKSFNSRQEAQINIREADLSLLETPQERALIRKLSEFPFAVSGACEALDPNRLTVYLNDLAKSFHSFYTECRVISEDTELSRARLFLVECCRCVLSNGLNLLNISLPEKM